MSKNADNEETTDRAVNEPAICLNCQQKLVGSYCHACGQQEFDPDLPAGTWFRDLVMSIFRLDTTFLRTASLLTIDPGTLVKRFQSGEQIRFTRPVRYVFVNCAIWLLVLSLLTSFEAGSFEAFYRQFGQLGSLVTIPLLAVVTWLAFWGCQVRYRDHVTIVLYWMGHCFLFRTLMLIVLSFGFMGSGPAGAIDLIVVVSLLFWSVFRFHQGHANWLIIRSLLAVAAVHFLSKLLFLGAVLLYLQYGGAEAL